MNPRNHRTEEEYVDSRTVWNDLMTRDEQDIVRDEEFIERMEYFARNYYTCPVTKNVRIDEQLNKLVTNFYDHIDGIVLFADSADYYENALFHVNSARVILTSIKLYECEKAEAQRVREVTDSLFQAVEKIMEAAYDLTEMNKHELCMDLMEAKSTVRRVHSKLLSKFGDAVS